MLLVEAYARERTMGEYRRVVSQIRKAIGRFSSEQMADVFDVEENVCNAVIDCLKTHPDWDNDQVAEAIDWED